MADTPDQYLKWKEIWTCFKEHSKMQWKIAVRMLVVLVILAAAWRGFLWLTGDYLPTNTNVALIMTWASVAVLLLAFFLDRIQSIEFKDIKLSFKEKLSEVANLPTISSTDFDSQIFARKGGIDALKDLLSAANRSPNTPVLLVVNLRNNHSISISMLFTYLFFLNLSSNPVNVLFVNEQNEIQNLKDVGQKSVKGVISGANVLRILYQHFPSLLTQIFVPGDNINGVSNPSVPQNISESFLVQFGEAAEQIINGPQLAEDANDQSQGYLTIRKVQTWFRGILNKRAISTKFTEDDIAEIRNALAANDDYVLCFDGDRLSSVIILCKFATKFAVQTLKT